MPTDTLDAMLADPDPVARLACADWLEEHQPERELLILSLRVGKRASRGRERVRLPGRSGYDLWSAGVRREAFRLYSRRTATVQWTYTVEGLWHLHWRRGHMRGSRPATPLPGLEAAVISVLRRRLAEAGG